MQDHALVADPLRLEPCELVEWALRAFTERRLDELLELMCHDAEIRPLRPSRQSVYRGARGIAQLLAELAHEHRDEQIVIADTLIAHDERIVAIGSVMTGAGATPFAAFHELRDGRIARAHHVFSDASLLQRLGLLD